MATIKIQPAPGHIIVEPIEDMTHNGIMIQITGGNKPKKGRIARMPGPTKSLRSKDVVYSSEQLSLKVGDIIYYECENPLIFNVGDADYHLISNWSVIAKEG